MCRGLCASDMLKDKNLNFYRKPANATSPHAPTNPSPILLVSFYSYVCTFLLLLSCFAYSLQMFAFFTFRKCLEYFCCFGTNCFFKLNPVTSLLLFAYLQLLVSLPLPASPKPFLASQLVQAFLRLLVSLLL
jgi:hypothetical protein